MTPKGLAHSVIGFSICLAAVTPILCRFDARSSKPAERELGLHKIAGVSIDAGQVEMQFINDQEGWIANGKKLLRTTDGGKGWQIAYAGEPSWDISASIGNLQFVSSAVGWMSEAVEGIFKTQDGGKSWTRWANPFPDGAIYSIRVSGNGKLAWVSGVVNRPPPKEFADKVPRPDSHAVISHTTDGGKTWLRQIIPHTRCILHLYFTDQDHGWALGWPGLFFLDRETLKWKSIDFYRGRCANQMLIKTLDPANVVHAPASLFFLHPNLGWLVFENGYMARTTDGGQTWCDLLNPRDVWPDPIGLTYFSKIHFVNSMRGWAIGYSSLYETRDGGAKWKKIDQNAEFKTMYFLKGVGGWVLGKDGLFRINQ